jgi:hypothetical protein
MITVTVNSRGESYSPDTIKNSKMPFKKLLKTYIRPGIRLMLRHFDKLETDKIVCASYTDEDPNLMSELDDFFDGTNLKVSGERVGLIGAKDLKLTVKAGPIPNLKEAYGDSGVLDSECREILDVDFSEFITERQKAANIQGTENYKTFDIDEQLKKRYPQVKNINALELYAQAADYHFTGYGGSIMKVLVTIPAYIFDQVPAAPDLPEVDTSIERLFISPRRLRTDLAKLKETIGAFSQFQAFFYNEQNGSLFYEETGETFYLKFYKKRVSLFENYLESLLKKNGFSYATFLSVRTPSLPFKIRFTFDKSDEKKPFTLKMVSAKTKGCPYKKLKKGLSSFLKKVNKDQTLLGLIANIEKISSDLNARETIGWLDFCYKYIYPNLSVNYGSSEKIKQGQAINCLADKLGLTALDDHVHNVVGRFSELFQYAINKQACRALSSDSPVPVTLTTKGNLAEKYGKQLAKKIEAGVNETSVFDEILKDFKENYDRVNGSEGALKILLSTLNPCNMFELTLKAIQCLMSQMSFEVSMRVIAKKALSTMAGAALEKVIEGLPYDKQEEIRNKVKAEFGNMPAPWEAGYEPGSLESVLDRKAAEDVSKKEQKRKDALNESSSLASKIETAIKRVEELQFCLSDPDKCTIEGYRRKEEQVQGELKPLAPLLTYADLLARGAKGEPVITLQIALSKLGYSITADGDYGPKTQTAVKKYQKDNGLGADGMVGSGTKDHINQKLKEKGTASTITKDSGTLRSDIFAEQIQQEKDLLNEVKKAQDFLKELEKNKEELERQQAELEFDIDSLEKQKQELRENKLMELNEIATVQMSEFDKSLRLANVRNYEDKIKAKDELILSRKQELQTILDSTAGMGGKYYDELIVAQQGAISYVQADLDAFFERDRQETVNKGVQEDSIDKRIKEIKAKWQEEIVKQQEELKKLKTQVSKNDDTLNDLMAYQIWDASDPDSKAKLTMMEREKYDKAFVTGLSPDDEIEQGTYGKGLGNIQQAIAMAYVEAIMDSVEINQLISLIDKIPGIKLIGNFLAGLKCPVKSFIYPPLSSFLSTLTFDPCGPGKTRLALPRLQDLPTFNGWNLLRLLADAFIESLKQVVIEVIVAIIFKLLSITFDIGCKTLGAAGRLLGNALTGNIGWRNAVDDLFCGADKPEDEREKHPELVLNAALPQLSQESAKEVAKTMSLIGTKNEYIRAITSRPEDQDLDFMKNLSTFIAAKHPELDDVLGTPEQIVGMFAQVGNFLTSEQISNLRNQLGAEDDTPLDQSICLTNDELDAWDRERRDALENAGLDPEIAKDFVDRQNERRKSDLADVIDIAAKTPEGLLGEALNKALNSDPTDPDCLVSKSVADVQKNDKFKEIADKATEGMFKRLESAFLDDVILWRWPIDPRGWLDSPGILSTILADKQGYTLNFHFIARRNIFFKILRFTTFFTYPVYEEFPKTVGKKFRDTFLDLDLTSKDGGSSFAINYDITDDVSWSSKTEIQNAFKITDSSGDKRYSKSFDYKFRQKSPENITGRFIVERQQTKEFIQWIKDNNLMPNTEELTKTPYSILTFKKYLRNIYKDFDVKISNSDSSLLIDSLTSLANTKLTETILSQDGDYSHGFSHGSKNSEITAEHLEYVAPNGGEYDFDEEEAVFGKPKKTHPRIKFLDPSEYGGEYSSPKVYISPPKDEGLMEISKVFLPNMKNGCEPKVGKTHFLFTDNLKEIVSKASNSIKTHKKLNYAPDCVKEYPFDKVASPATLGALEGSVIATIRVYLSDFLIKTMPVWSNLSFEPQIQQDGKPSTTQLANYDELVAEYVAQLMKRGLSNETSLFARATYEGYTYWLLFLEQVAQIVQRRVKDGTFEETTEIKKAFDEINRIQNQHIVPTFGNMRDIAIRYSDGINLDDLQDDYLARSVVEGGAIIGGLMSRGTLPAGGTLGAVAWSLFGLNQAKFSSKVYSLHRGRKACIALLKYLILEQLTFYQGELRSKLQQLELEPFYYSLNHVFVGSHGAALGKAPESGIWPTSGITEGPTREFGDVNHVSSNPMEKHTLSDIKMSKKDFDFLEENGGIYLEKYIRILDNDDPSIPEFIRNRPEKLRGVVNIKDFKEFIENNKDKIEPNQSLSFMFPRPEDGEAEKKKPRKKKKGDKEAEDAPEKEEFASSVGALFGVRLCYIPPSDFRPFSGTGRPNAADRAVAMREKSFLHAPMTITVPLSDNLSNLAEGVAGAVETVASEAEEVASGFGSLGEGIGSLAGSASGAISGLASLAEKKKELKNSVFSFPLTSCEIALENFSIEDLLKTDANLNQDIKCYVDQLVATKEFEFVFDKIVNLRKVGSVSMVTTYDSWVPSIGAVGTDERLKPEAPEAYEDAEEDPPTYNEPANTKAFNDSRSECRKLFISNYKRKDFDPDDEEEDFDFVKDNLNRMLSNTYSAVLYSNDVPFWMKWKVTAENPDDENGEACGNQFSKLFKK